MASWSWARIKRRRKLLNSYFRPKDERKLKLKKVLTIKVSNGCTCTDRPLKRPCEQTRVEWEERGE